jgi:hypothetical protein
MKNTMVVNDFHVGSFYSICPPTVKVDTKDKNGKDFEVNYNARELQKEIYDRWERVCERSPPIDLLIVNGDMMDGPNYKGKGEGLWTNLIRVQCVVCADLLEMLPITKDTIIRMTYSSAYHSGHNPSGDEILYQELQARGYNNISLKYSQAIQVNDLRMHIGHKVGVSMNDTTALTKEIDWAISHRQDFGKIDCIFRGHAHVDAYVTKRNVHAWIVPGWKGRDEYVSSAGLRFDPCIGCLLLQIPEKGKEFTWKWEKFALKDVLDWEVI